MTTHVEGREQFVFIVGRLDEHGAQHDPLLQVDGLAAVGVGDEQVLIELLVTRCDAQQREPFVELGTQDDANVVRCKRTRVLASQKLLQKLNTTYCRFA
jgi:hypothetical protein